MTEARAAFNEFKKAEAGLKVPSEAGYRKMLDINRANLGFKLLTVAVRS